MYVTDQSGLDTFSKPNRQPVKASSAHIDMMMCYIQEYISPRSGARTKRGSSITPNYAVFVYSLQCSNSYHRFHFDQLFGAWRLAYVTQNCPFFHLSRTIRPIMIYRITFLISWCLRPSPSAQPSRNYHPVACPQTLRQHSQYPQSHGSLP